MNGVIFVFIIAPSLILCNNEFAFVFGVGIEPDADVLGALVVRTLEQYIRGGAVLDERYAMPTGGFVRFTQFVFSLLDGDAQVEFGVLVHSSRRILMTNCSFSMRCLGVSSFIVLLPLVTRCRRDCYLLFIRNWQGLAPRALFLQYLVCEF